MFNPLKYMLVIATLFTLLFISVNNFCENDSSLFSTRCVSMTLPVQIPRTLLLHVMYQGLISIIAFFFITHWIKDTFINVVVLTLWAIFLMGFLFFMNNSLRSESCRLPIHQHNLNLNLDTDIFLDGLTLTAYESIATERHQLLRQILLAIKEYLLNFPLILANILITLPLIYEKKVQTFFLKRERKRQQQENTKLVTLFENVDFIPQATWKAFVALLINPNTQTFYVTPVFSKDNTQIHIQEKSDQNLTTILHERAKNQIIILGKSNQKKSEILAGNLEKETKTQLLDTLWHLSECDGHFLLDPVMLQTGWSYNRPRLLAFWNYAAEGAMNSWTKEYEYLCPKSNHALGTQQPALPKDTLIAAQIDLLLAVEIPE